MRPRKGKPMPEEASISEIEYKPIRRKSREGRGVSVSEDEISVLEARPTPSQVAEEQSVPQSTPPEQSIPHSVPEEDSPLPAVSVEEPLSEEEVTEDLLPPEDDVQECLPLYNPPEEVEESVVGEVAEESVIREVTPPAERVVLPDEISLADVLPFFAEPQAGVETTEEDLPQEVEEEPTESVTTEPATETESVEEEEEEFVFTPMPELVEYERVVLPDEISLVDVLPQVRPKTEEGENATTGVVEDVPEQETTVVSEENSDSELGELPLPEEEMESPVVESLPEGEEPATEALPEGEVSGEEVTITDALPEEEPSLSPDFTEPEEVSVAEEAPSAPDTQEEEVTLEEETPEETEEGTPQSEPQDAESTEEVTPSQQEQAKPDMPKERRIDGRFDLLELFAFTLAFVMLLTTFFFRSSTVVGSSMESTLHNGDQLILYSFMYEPAVGDIIVFEDYSTGYREPLVKRVIATEGQRVEIYDAYNVYIDGVKLEEDYIFLDGPDLTNYPIFHTVEEGHIFVMGDHRNGSSDSRIFRDVSVDTVLGKVLFRYYPFDTFKKFN